MAHTDFDRFFRDATASQKVPGGFEPFDFQRRLACGDPAGRGEAGWLSSGTDCRSLLVNVPTGLGKTAAVVLGWLWNRLARKRTDWPRRLVYCLPMRVLVEQTRDNAVLWLHNLGVLGGAAKFESQDGRTRLRSYTPEFTDSGKVTVHILMGGEDEDDWDLHPEREAIVIGTQDMLLSRALNRGYAASRARWPIQFGLLNTDCLWVFDEAQLMGSGLATTAQLEAFRCLLGSRDGHGCHSIWMSATLERDWLKTVDFRDRVDSLSSLELTDDDHKNEEVKKRWEAQKRLNRTEALIGDARALASEILNAHKNTHKPGTRTIVVVNTVRRACKLFDALCTLVDASKAKAKGRKGKETGLLEPAITGSASKPELVLLHSRFRPGDRARAVEAALADREPQGTIVVSTQVIEAGVDVSATTLFTELAPWASLVQRFGRCNRRGEANEHAQVRWIDVPDKEAAPYDVGDLQSARTNLRALEKTSVGLEQLEAHIKELSDDDKRKLFKFEHTHVIRRKDLIDLFDTTPDLAGNDIDIDRFVREIEDSDVRVLWRDWDGDKPPDVDHSPFR